jgi:alpha-mannosidase
VQLPARAHSATETDLMEKALGELPLREGRVSVHTRPYEIKTLKVDFGKIQ